MSQEQEWSVPASGEILAAFRYNSGELVGCVDQDTSDEYLPAARQTLAVWEAAQIFPNATLLIIKSNDRVSIASLKGGVIIEGRSKLNIGLMRASTRNLNPVLVGSSIATSIINEDRFQRTVWAILSRFHDAVLPRVFTFDLAGVFGTVRVQDGNLRFEGDFSNPTAFLGELKAACAIDDEVKYSLGSHDDVTDGEEFPLSDFLDQAFGKPETSDLEFDATGWPVSSPSQVGFRAIQAMSTIANTLAELDGGKGSSTVSLLSDSNSPLLSGFASSEGTVRFSLQ